MAFLRSVTRLTRKPIPLIIFFIAISSLSYQVAAGQHQQAPVSNVKTQLLLPNLPPSHYQFWLKNNPSVFRELQSICSLSPVDSFDRIEDLKHFRLLHANLSIQDPQYLNDLNYGKIILKQICSKIDVVMKSCWGYENNCEIIHLMPECQAKYDRDRKITWFNQADFGYVLERRRELDRYCSLDKYSNKTVKSSLECTKYFRTCRGENLFMRFNLSKVGGNLIENPNKKRLIEKGDVGGWNCDLQSKRILEEGSQPGYLQSWFTELENYKLLEGSQPNDICDETIEKQVFIIKLDSTSNMYHYFCNFLNLYATFHLNNRFSEDNQIIIWDIHSPFSRFEEMWSVFSKNPLKTIGNFDGRRVCFKKFVFALLPRMVDGLYYNTPLISGCYKTGLLDAFNKHVLHKLNIRQDYSVDFHKKIDNKVIRITLVARNTTLYRSILNLVDLESAIKSNSSDYIVHLIDFADHDFKQQLNVVQNTDILVGIHGAGLTHTLFLPDWAALVELHDCGDKCYYDLARLRGVSYISPKNREKLIVKHRLPDARAPEHDRKSANDKFSNYLIKPEEFFPTLVKATKIVRRKRAKHFNDLEKMDIEKVVSSQKSSESVESKVETKHQASTHTEL